MKIISRLVEDGIIDKSKASFLESEAERTGQSEEEIVLKEKVVPEDFLFKLKSRILKIPLKEVVVEEIPLEVLELIPEESAINYKMIPLAKKGNFVEIGMVYPEDVSAQEALRFLSRQGNFNYKVFLITFRDLEKLLRQHRTLKREAEKALVALEKEKITLPPIKKEVGVLEEITEEAPIVKMVSVILKHAIEGKASDIHIEPTRNKLRVRFRLEGILHSSLFLPLRVHPSIVARIKILSNLKIDETRIPQDGRFTSKIGDQEVDFRVSTFPTMYGEKVVLRVLVPGQGLKSHTELGLRGRNLKVVEEAVKRPYGLILATGPTGSGKTTTLYALLRTLNKESANIVTIEDPIEYSIEGIIQSQVKPEIGYDFAQGLRHILRQDPDIIMVGEIRDEETAALVIHAALTGHLVFSTLHTNNAIGVIPRLIDMRIRPFLLPPVLNLAISQRLVRVLCPHCRKKIRPSSKIKEYILEKVEALPPATKKEIRIPKTIFIFEPQGCEKCGFRGYSGRTGIFEVLKMTESLAKIILTNPNETAILKEAKNQGMITMEQDGILKVLKGETTIEELTRITEEI